MTGQQPHVQLVFILFFYFSTKLAVLSNSLPQKKALTLPSLTSQPHQVLASDLVPYSDVQQVIIHEHAIWKIRRHPSKKTSCWSYRAQ